MLDILCVGGSVIDIFLKIPQDNPHFGLDKEEKNLLISLGEKIVVDKYLLDIGGNATNSAVGMARLGLSVGLCAEIGKDEFSQKILNKLRDENINIDSIIQTENENTSFSIGLSFKGERTLLTEHVKRNHNFNFDGVQTKFVYLTSLGNIWEKAYEKTLDYVIKTNVKLAFNPGTLQIQKRDKIVMEVIEHSEYLFVNKQEAEELLYGEELDVDLKNETGFEKKLLFGLKSLGAKNVIITDSTRGSYLLDSENNYKHLGIVKVDVVEKTGAGDAYSAGFLSAILNGESQSDAMVWGSIVSACVIQKVGAEQGLPSKNDFYSELKKLADFHPKTI